MAKSSGSGATLDVVPKKMCCRSRKRCKRCPVVIKKARASLARDGFDVGQNPRMIQLTVDRAQCKKMRKRLDRAISAARS
jgi:hypothetical protein